MLAPLAQQRLPVGREAYEINGPESHSSFRRPRPRPHPRRPTLPRRPALWLALGVRTRQRGGGRRWEEVGGGTLTVTVRGGARSARIREESRSTAPRKKVCCLGALDSWPLSRSSRRAGCRLQPRLQLKSLGALPISCMLFRRSRQQEF